MFLAIALNDSEVIARMQPPLWMIVSQLSLKPHSDALSITVGTEQSRQDVTFEFSEQSIVRSRAGLAQFVPMKVDDVMW